MYPISDELKKLFLDGNKKCVKLTLNGVSFENDVITEADVLSDSLTVDRYCSSGNKIEVGSAIAAELTLTLVNNNEKFGDKIFEGADVALEIGIEGVSDSFIPCGKFTVDEPPRSSFHIKLKALDYMMRFDKRVDLTKLSFPMSVEALLDRICEICEVEISPDINLASLPNMDQTVMNAPASGDLTYRQILQWIAQITGTCAFMDWNGKICLSWFTDTGMTLTPSLRYIGGNIDENDITISGVTVGTETKGSADYALLIEGNQLIYPGTEEALAENIYNAIKGLTYRPFACNCIPMPFLYPLDIVSYEELNGNIIQTVITNHNFGLNKASALSAIGETATKNNYSSRRGITKQEIDAAISEALKGIDSKAEHIYIKYSPYDGGYDEDGKLVWSDTPTADTVYLGTCATNNATAPDTPSSYKWVKIRGADGKNGKDGKDGQDGENGKDGQDGNDGRGVSKVETEYRLSTSDTSLSSGYTWGTDAPTWQDGLFLWTRLATTFTDNTTEYSDPVVDASWKKTSVVDAASKELNETLANALGLHVTEYPVGTSKIRYYHSNPSLTDSKSGDTILVFNAKGFGVCTTGWNGGNPVFQNGAEFEKGKAVWNILAANKISADLIEAGVLSSHSNSDLQTKLDLATGILRFIFSEGQVTAKGFTVGNEADLTAEENEELKWVSLNRWPGVHMNMATPERNVCAYYTPYGLMVGESSYIEAIATYAIQRFKYECGKGTEPLPLPDYLVSEVGPDYISSKEVLCSNLVYLSSAGREKKLKDLDSNVLSLSAECESLRTSLTLLQQKYAELLEEIGKTCEHPNTEIRHENVVSPTCTAQGSYDEVVYCSTCGEKLSVTKKYTSALGHNYTSVVTPPTSTSGGYTTHTCQTCGSSYTDNYTDAIKYFTATIYSSGAGSGDVVRIAKNTSGEDWGKNQFSVGDKFCFYAEANSGKVISSVQVTSNGVVTTYSAKDLEDVGALTVARTKLTYPYNLMTVTSALLGTSISMTVLFEEAPASELTISAGETKVVNVDTDNKAGFANFDASEFTLVKFVPTTTGVYEFSSISVSNAADSDTCGCLFNADKTQQINNDDQSGGNGHFKFTQNCTAGVTYYIGVKFFYENYGGDIEIKVSYIG